MAIAGLELRLRSRSALNPIRLDLRLGSRAAPYLLFDRAHLWNLDEIWLAEEYGPLADSHFDLILDLGANVGAATIWFHEHFPEARIVAVEPDPRTASLLRRNTGHLDRVTVVEAAVSTEPGAAQLLAGSYSWGSRLLAHGETHDPTNMTWRVQKVTIPSLLEDAGAPNGAHILAKMDVEGSEWPLLASPPALERLTEIYGETHRMGAPIDSARFFADTSQAAGFETLAAPPTLFHWRRRSARV